CYKRSFHNQPSVAFAAESERLGGTCASLLENVRINRCSRYLNAYGEDRVLTSHPRSAARKARAKETAQQHTGGANHSAFPARWSDGLCRALPGAEFLLASLTLAEFTGSRAG
ncbi:hypothetical protein, partial [Bradyrhizobium vignae]